MHEIDARAGEHEAPHPFGMLEDKERSNPRAHRITHHVGALDAEMIEQTPRILGHLRRAVELRVVQLLALAVPAIVERDDPASSPG